MMYTMPKNLLSICVNFTLATQPRSIHLRGFSLSKKQYSIFMLRAAARIQSNLLCKFINSGSMYLGIYTREEKMCPQDAVFLRDSLESVVSSERLFGKRSFSTASIPFSVEKGIFFLFRKVFLNQLTRILNAARAGAPYIAVGYALEVAAQIRAVLLLKLLLEHFRDLIGLTLGRARLIRSCAVLHAREHERTAQRAAHLHAAHAEAEAFRHFIGGLLIQTNQIAVRADHRLCAVVALIVKILCQFCPFCHNKYLLFQSKPRRKRRGQLI